MQVDVVATVSEAIAEDFLQKTVIAIDVLRATSTIVTALAHGCSAVLPVETVNQAKQLAQPGDLLGGERFCKKIAGFHLGNSPLEYTEAEVARKRVILTTTNGTRAIQKAQRAAHVLAGSFLNAEAVARTVHGLNRDVVILCAGTKDEFALEDGLCAGLLIEKLSRLRGESPEVNDLGLAMRIAYDQVKERLKETLLQSSNGKRLAKIGFRDDVSYCAETDRIGLVPVLKEQSMIRF